jgi:hypothetical protein
MVGTECHGNTSKNRQKYYTMTNFIKQGALENIGRIPEEYFLLFDEGWGKMYGS